MDRKQKIALVVGGCAVIAIAIGVAWAIRQSGSASGLLPGGRQVSAFSTQPFSATMTIITPGPKVQDIHHPGMGAGANAPKPATYHGKMYAGATALRTDIEMQPGKTASVIVRYDKGVAWILTPSRRYIEAPIEERDDLLSALRDRNAKIVKQDIGAEQVGAYPCEKYRVQVTEKDKPQSGWIWVAKAKNLNGFIVKAEDETSEETVVLSDIRLTAPQSSMFDLPPGYQKVTATSAPTGDDDDD